MVVDNLLIILLVIAIIAATFLYPFVRRWGRRRFGEDTWSEAEQAWGVGMSDGAETKSAVVRELEKRIETLETLAERVAALETIVTDGRYELKREFDQLKRRDGA
jgi:hypothetical protein